MKTIERLNDYLKAKGITPAEFERACKMSNGSFGKQLKKKGGISSNLLEKIARAYPDLNLGWLITGTGPMIVKGPKSSKEDEQATLKVEEEHAAYQIKSRAAELIKEGLDLLNSTLKRKRKLRN